MPVFVVGPLAFDDVRTTAAHRRDVLGGSGLYASLAAAKHGPVALVSVVGEDFRDAALAPLVAAHVDLSGVARRQGKTLRWSGRYGTDFATSDVRNTELGVVAGWRPRPPPAATGTFVLLANTDPAAQLSALESFGRPELLVVDTMDEWIQRERTSLERVIARADIVSLTEPELLSLAGTGDVGSAAGLLIGQGPRAVVLKRGDSGVTLFDPGPQFSVPAYPARTIDPTGAGDALAGAFLGALARTGAASDQRIREAVLHGAVAASFAVESFGADALSRATAHDLDLRYRWLAARTGTAGGTGLYQRR